MKRIAVMLWGTLGCLLCLSVVPAAADYEKPAKQFYAADYAGVMSEEHEQYYIDQGAALERATGAQIVVAAIPSLQGEAIEDYAHALFRSWGIGDAQKNNGLLILLAVSDRKIRTEVGYGLEGALNDAKTGRLTDTYAIPHLREDDFDTGLYQLYNAYLPLIYKEYGLQPPESVERVAEEGQQEDSNSSAVKLLILVVIIILLTSSSGRHRGGRGGGMWIGRGFGGYYGGLPRGGGFSGGSPMGRGGFSGGRSPGGRGFSGGGGRSGGGGSSRGF